MSKRQYRFRDSGLLVPSDWITLPKVEIPRPWYAGKLSAARAMSRRKCCCGTCNQCADGTPSSWLVELASFAEGTCGDCTGLNGSYVCEPWFTVGNNPWELPCNTTTEAYEGWADCLWQYTFPAPVACMTGNHAIKISQITVWIRAAHVIWVWMGDADIVYANGDCLVWYWPASSNRLLSWYFTPFWPIQCFDVQSQVMPNLVNYTDCTAGTCTLSAQ